MACVVVIVYFERKKSRDATGLCFFCWHQDQLSGASLQPRGTLDYISGVAPSSRIALLTDHHYTFRPLLGAPLKDMAKRAAPQEEGSLIKRARSSEPEANNQQLAISSSNDERQKALVRSVKRTSNLEAPIVSLSGSHAVSFRRQVLPGYSK